MWMEYAQLLLLSMIYWRVTSMYDKIILGISSKWEGEEE